MRRIVLPQVVKPHPAADEQRTITLVKSDTSLIGVLALNDPGQPHRHRAARLHHHPFIVAATFYLI